MRNKCAAVVTLALLLALHGSCSLSHDSPEDGVVSFKMMRSTSGSWEVFGTNDLEMAGALRWAEETARSVARIIGAADSNAAVGKIVLPPASVATETPVCRIVVTNGIIVRRLDLPSADMLSLARNTPYLCRILMENPVGSGGGGTGLVAPEWLCVGIAQNLYSANKAWNTSEMLQRWRDGRAGSLRRLLDTVQKVGDGRHDAVYCGTIVTWILSWPRGKECVRAIARGETGEGGRVSPEWLLQWRDGCGSASDLDEAWDRWVLSQRRLVYEVGLVTPALVRELEMEMYFWGSDGRALTASDLASGSIDGTVRAAAAARSMTTRLLAAGRDVVFQEAASAVADFLDAVADPKISIKRRREQLSKAERAIRAAKRRADELWPRAFDGHEAEDIW